MSILRIIVHSTKWFFYKNISVKWVSTKRRAPEWCSTKKDQFRSTKECTGKQFSISFENGNHKWNLRFASFTICKWPLSHTNSSLLSQSVLSTIIWLPPHPQLLPILPFSYWHIGKVPSRLTLSFHSISFNSVMFCDGLMLRNHPRGRLSNFEFSNSADFRLSLLCYYASKSCCLATGTNLQKNKDITNYYNTVCLEWD